MRARAVPRRPAHSFLASNTREDIAGAALLLRYGIEQLGGVLVLADDGAPGFGELFRWISFQEIGTSTIQSRATGGVINATYVFVLPGSPGACRDAWDEILKPQLDYRHMPCNFVEIMPRLDEHLRRAKG